MSAKRNTYRVLLHPLEAGQPGTLLQGIEFTHSNHDDLARIVKLAQASSGLSADSAASMAVGLKLLAETVLQHRDNTLFDVLRQPLGEFIGVLKARAATVSP